MLNELYSIVVAILRGAIAFYVVLINFELFLDPNHSGVNVLVYISIPYGGG